MNDDLTRARRDAVAAQANLAAAQARFIAVLDELRAAMRDTRQFSTNLGSNR
jgi:hypothetical protein